MRLISILLGLASCLGFRPAEACGGFALRQIEGGGYAIERAAGQTESSSVHGLASMADLASLLQKDAAAPSKIDFAAGQKLDGIYTLLIERSDGTLAKYERASDVIIFAAPSTLAQRGDITTLNGAVVFALKIDNAGATTAIQRFETGAISMFRTKGSL